MSSVDAAHRTGERVLVVGFLDFLLILVDLELVLFVKVFDLLVLNDLLVVELLVVDALLE